MHFASAIVADGIRADQIEDMGWALLLAEGTPPAVTEALQPLLDLRKSASPDGLFRQISIPRNVSPSDFIQSIGGAIGQTLDPASEGVAGYFLIVADPSEGVSSQSPGARTRALREVPNYPKRELANGMCMVFI
jgi:hypothetical protein